MKAIIYYRKSTDRDDKQANSLEHQLDNCRNISRKHSLDIYKEIWESRSAKTEWTRPWFNDLIKFCKTWKIDYIIIDEPKRLSRNNIDTSRIIDLLDKKQIKWILWTSREYNADNSRDKFLLQLDLSLSKMDNEDRAKDIKDKMNSCIERTWRFLWKAPFWYKNITIKKWYKEIIIDTLEAKIVKEIYWLRLENKAFSTIWNILKRKYWNKINLTLEPNRLHKLVNKKFYYWVFTWNGKDIIWSHKPIISKEIYDKANWVWKWVHEKVETLLERGYKSYTLKWFVKDSSWIYLTSCEKKWQTYYLTQYRSADRININENILFEKIWELIQNIEWINEPLKEIDKRIIINRVKEENIGNINDISTIDYKIDELKNKKDKILDLKIDNVIDDEVFLRKNNEIENQIKSFLDEKNRLKKDDFLEKTQIMIELAGSLYQSYFRANFEWKVYIIKNLMIELLVNTKKELQIAETPLFESSKMLNFSFGTPENFDIRTFKKYLSMIDLDKLKEFYEFIK